MKRIGILGGTFNPIHNAHLHMAKCAMEQAKLDEVWFMPTKNPPHKTIATKISDEQRSDMIRLAIQDEPRFLYSDFELHRTGTTYTSETLDCLIQNCSTNHFYFIMGGDSFFALETWHKPAHIMEMVDILAVARDDVSREQMENRKRELTAKYHARIQIVAMVQEKISSHEIRESIAKGVFPSAMLPSAVEEYIRNNHLYGCRA